MGGEKSFFRCSRVWEGVCRLGIFFVKDGILKLFVASVFSGKIKGDSKALSGG